MSEYIVKAADYVIDYNGNSAFKDCERIVRCRDCRHYTHSSWHRCDLYSIAHEVEPDGFCAWGERREQ